MSAETNHADTLTDAFVAAFRGHAGGVAVVTADPGDGPVGMTVTSLASVSVAPPMFVFSASGRSSSTPALMRTETVVAHLLTADDVAVGRIAATHGVDRFSDDVPWERLPNGAPAYVCHGIRIAARIVQRVQAGDSTLCVAEVESVDGLPGSAAPLVYWNRTWHALGGHSDIETLGRMSA